jgi:hypothetical protein
MRFVCTIGLQGDQMQISPSVSFFLYLKPCLPQTLLIL